MSESTPTIFMEVSPANQVTTPVDDTLSISGMAADAKATGDAIAQAKSDLQGEIADAKTDLQGEIDTLSGNVSGIAGSLFPVGSICVSTSATAPTFGGTNWNWQEIKIPMTWGDLEDGFRSYQAKGETDTPGTLHFWLRVADSEV